MKTILIAGITLMALVSGCGQLPPDRAKQIANNNGSNNRIDTSQIKVASMLANFTGATDIQYTTFFNSTSAVFSFVVVRANQQALTSPQIVTLTATDNSTLYDALGLVFTNKQPITMDNPCTVGSTMTVSGLNGGSVQYQCPAMLDSTGKTNVMPDLNRYVSHHLQ